MTDKYIPPHRVLMMEEPKIDKPRTLEIGYGTDGLRIGVLDDSGYHVSVVPVDRASLLIEAIMLAAGEYRDAKAKGGGQ